MPTFTVTCRVRKGTTDGIIPTSEGFQPTPSFGDQFNDRVTKILLVGEFSDG